MDDLEGVCELVIRGQNPEKEKVQWLFEGVIPQQGLGMILGETGKGKSLFAIHLMSCLATQSSCFPYHEKHLSNEEDSTSKIFGAPTMKAASLYITGEGHNGIIDRIGAAESVLNDYDKAELPLALCPKYDLEKQLPILDYRKNRRRLKNAEELEALIKKIDSEITSYEHQGYLLKLIVIDTMTSMFEIEQENNNSEMDRLMDELSLISKKLNCFILVTAHPPKSKRSSQDGSRGSGSPKNSAEVVFKIKGTNGSNVRKVEVIKLREGSSDGMIFNFRIKSVSGSGVIIPEPSSQTKADQKQSKKNNKISDGQRQILEAIERIQDKKSSTISVLLKELKTLKPQLKLTSLRKQLDRGLPALEEKRLIKTLTGDEGDYYQTTEKCRLDHLEDKKAGDREKARNSVFETIPSKICPPPTDKIYGYK